MSVARHLGIRLAEYDERIRTFIPHYDEMLAVAAACVPADARTLLDLGVGTGALARQCLRAVRRARVIGIDADPEILAFARRRLGARARLVAGSFLRADLPRADAAVASFSLHHVRTRAAKARLYRRLRHALGRRGTFVTADCYPPTLRPLRAAHRRAWLEHLETRYTPGEGRRLLRAWGREDVYTPLDAELHLLRHSGFRPDVVWRRDGFAVVVGR